MESLFLLVLLSTLIFNGSAFVLKPGRLLVYHNQRRSSWLMSGELEAPLVHLKVPASAWKWPAKWPFNDDVFQKVLDSSKVEFSDVRQMLNDKVWDYLLAEKLLTGKVLVVNSQSNQREKSALMNELVISPTLQSINNLEDESFDSIVVFNGYDATDKPLDVFKKLWKTLKPNGRCNIVIQAGLNQTTEQLPIKLWTTTTDEQKIWIAGSYMNYAVRSGWTEIEAYDVGGITGNETMSFQTSGSAEHPPVFLVRGTKIAIEPVSPSSSTEEITAFLEKKLLSVSYLDELERRLLSMRLTNHLVTKDFFQSEYSSALKTILQKLESIYSVLVDVKDTIIPRPSKVLLAYLLIDKWNGTTKQIEALKMSVGLLPPSEDFWRPIGTATMKLSPTDKLYFLADIIGEIGRDDLHHEKVATFPHVLQDVIRGVQMKLPELNETDTQQIAVELVVSEHWLSTKPTNSLERINRFVQTSEKSSLLAILSRK